MYTQTQGWITQWGEKLFFFIQYIFIHSLQFMCYSTKNQWKFFTLKSESEEKIHSRIFLTFELGNFSFSGFSSSLFFCVILVWRTEGDEIFFSGIRLNNKKKTWKLFSFAGLPRHSWMGKLYPHVYVSLHSPKKKMIFTARILSYIIFFIKEKTRMTFNRLSHIFRNAYIIKALHNHIEDTFTHTHTRSLTFLSWPNFLHILVYVIERKLRNFLKKKQWRIYFYWYSISSRNNKKDI